MFDIVDRYMVSVKTEKSKAATGLANVEKDSRETTGTIATFRNPADNGLTRSGPAIVDVIAMNVAQRITPVSFLRRHKTKAASINQGFVSLRIDSEAKQPFC